jgi:formate dehydrogenase subunit gamma
MSRSGVNRVIDVHVGSEERARAICAAHGDRPDELLEIFHAVQHELGFVPDPAVVVIANALNVSRADVYGVLSFYHEFRRAPAGRHVVKMCRAEACQAMHSDEVCAHAEERLGTIFGETSDDGAYTLEAVYCLGNCALSPAMMVDGQLHGRVDASRFDEIMAETLSEAAQ